MSSKLNDAVAAAASSVLPNQDKLEALRLVVRAHRDLQKRIADLEEQLSEAKKTRYKMEMRELPEMFYEVGVDRIGIPEEGNHPAYDAVLQPYYHANIPADQRDQAFEWLQEKGHGDLIKTVVKVELGLRQREVARKVESMLEKLGVDYSRDLGVPWNTLTAWLKEQIEKHQEIPPLTMLGATVGNIVKLKERKT